MMPCAICYCLYLHEGVLIDAHVENIWGREQLVGRRSRIQKAWTDDVVIWLTRSLIQSLICLQSIVDWRPFNLVSKFWQRQITWMMAVRARHSCLSSQHSTCLPGSANTSSSPRVGCRRKNDLNVLTGIPLAPLLLHFCRMISSMLPGNCHKHLCN